MRGVTLLELVVVLTLLAVFTGVVGVTLSSLRVPAEARLLHELRAARDSAITQGRAVVWDREGTTIRFLPDGSSSGGMIVVDDLRAAVDPVTGAIHAAE